MIQIQVREGIGWKTVAHREGSEMDHPKPVRAQDIGVRPGDICRLALTENHRVLRKRMIAAVS